MDMKGGVEGRPARPNRRCGEFNLIELGVPHPLLGGRKLDFEGAKAIADGFVDNDDEVTVRFVCPGEEPLVFTAVAMGVKDNHLLAMWLSTVYHQIN